MQRTKFVLIFLVLLLGSISCLEPYLPQFSGEEISTMVISGGITDQPGINNIYVSVASSLSKPEFLPVNRCTGYVSDDEGNNFNLEEKGDGLYQVTIDQNYLQAGKRYMLFVQTPSGAKYQSDFETMPQSSPIDTVHYAWEIHQTTNPLAPEVGLQFYGNFKIRAEDTQFYRWQVDETWEYRSPYPIEYYYSGRSRKITKLDAPDYSKVVCYSSLKDPKIYTMTTQNLAQNEYENYPLHYIQNTSEKLLYSYSALISKFGLSEQAYKFYDELKQNTDGKDGLYNKQPLQVKGNIHCITDPSKKVLGYFYASSLQTKRIFLSDVQGLNVILDFCQPWYPKAGLDTYLQFTPYDQDVYLVHTDTGNYMANRGCFDCRLRGGSLTKPSFMP